MIPTLTLRDDPSSTSSIATESCTTATPGKYGAVPKDACNSYYPFDPSFSANCAFAVLFGLTLVAHIAQAITWKKKFCWVIGMGASWEMIAFIIRTLGAHDQQQIGYQIAGQLFFLLAPLWINAYLYMTVARIVYFVLPEPKVFGVKAPKLTRVFVIIDIVCFLIQAVGGSMMSSTDTQSASVRTGQKLYMSGIGAQLGFILVFIGGMCRLVFKMRSGTRPGINMKRINALIGVTFAALIFIVIRIIFRLAEFGPGMTLDNKIITNENYALVLDGMPMFLAMLLLNIVHPGWVLRGDYSEFPHISRQEKKQLKREKKAAKRAAKEGKLVTDEFDERGSEEMDSMAPSYFSNPSHTHYQPYDGGRYNDV